MPNDDTHPLTPPLARWQSPLFTIPSPVKRIFDRFPLLTYTSNSLPIRCPCPTRRENVLYLFTSVAGAEAGQPSFNPACLKWQVSCHDRSTTAEEEGFIANGIDEWQTYLKFHHVPFRTVQSNNHAAPPGTALPFLLPAQPDADAVPSGKLKKWCAATATTSPSSHDEPKKNQEEGKDKDEYDEIYASLLELRIRKAWVRPPIISSQIAPWLR